LAAVVIGLQYYCARDFNASRQIREGTNAQDFIGFMFAALAALLPALPARAADVICYNCPPQWADFASMLKVIKADLGYDIPFASGTNRGRCRAVSVFR
jgi:hypothetical protein